MTSSITPPTNPNPKASSPPPPSAATTPSTTSSKPPNPSNLTQIHTPTNTNPLVRRFPAAPNPSNSNRTRHPLPESGAPYPPRPTPSSPPYQICPRATHHAMSSRSYSRHGGAPNPSPVRSRWSSRSRTRPKTWPASRSIGTW
uniref:Uncharacterized protein n=1 Tax=Opuntia streptacantha TaxID=393608 RepID=A0A7C9DZH1_OPUST